MDFPNYSNYGDGGFNSDAQYTDSTGGDGSGSQRTQQTRNIVSPVTIKQINDATQPVPDGDYVSGKVILNMISFVGVVRKVENQTSAVLVTVEDGTGSLDIRRWIDEKMTTANEETEMFLAWENKYVHVSGALKEFNQKKAVQHSHVRVITDHNEVIYHMMYAIFTHLLCEGLLGVGTMKEKTESGLFVGSAFDAMESAHVSDQDRILALIAANSEAMADGVPVSWVSSSLNIPESAVLATCSVLTDEGKIYAGYDATTFLSV